MPTNSNKDYYFIIRDTEPAESVLVEYAFLDSTKDDKNQIRNDWQKWAEASVKAIAEYKGYNYKPPYENIINNVYKVQKGDSLWSVAKRFNVGVNELKQVNNLNSNLINVGQNLVIPGVAPSDQTNITYIVQKGDSLWSIAASNNTTVDEIANLNDLGNKTIYVGQVLKIPNTQNITQNDNEESNKITYIVEKGDSLYSIAKKYNTKPELIVSKNNLMDNIIVVGQILDMPLDVESTGNDNDFDFNDTYIVQKGDTLYSISNKYNVPVFDIKNLNNLTNDTLVINEVIKLPKNKGIVTDSEQKLYVVQKGDTLWSISRRFNVSVNQIRMLNNLSTDILNIGQTLIIP